MKGNYEVIVNFYSILADLTIVLHVAYIAIVIGGQLAIMVGWPLKWNWIRNPWFRGIHLTMILIVAVEAFVEFECPLTTLEYALRVDAGQLPPNFRELEEYQIQDMSFIGRNLQAILFCRGITDILTWCYYGFAALVAATLILVPPRFRPSDVAAKGDPDSTGITTPSK